MDPELKANLVEIRRQIETGLSSLGSDLREEIKDIRAEIKAAEDRLETKIDGRMASLETKIDGQVARLDAKIDAVVTAVGTEIETMVIPQIQQVAEGVANLREQMDRRFDEYHRALMDEQIGPLKALALNNKRRLDNMEPRR
ncbi:MAG TPA: hypothetical protein VNM16_03460 [Bacillota bacterium]|nr:hypothetical protein [Bacillota bacterium]